MSWLGRLETIAQGAGQFSMTPCHLYGLLRGNCLYPGKGLPASGYKHCRTGVAVLDAASKCANFAGNTSLYIGKNVHMYWLCSWIGTT